LIVSAANALPAAMLSAKIEDASTRRMCFLPGVALSPCWSP
jgi:hypothetical protein